MIMITPPVPLAVHEAQWKLLVRHRDCARNFVSSLPMLTAYRSNRFAFKFRVS